MKAFFSLIFLALLGYGAWPYYHVWDLDRAVARNDREAMARLVDLDAVRGQIKRRLNKEVNSAVGDVSNEFIDWLQDGIRRMGSDAVERLVDLDWVRRQLLSKNAPQPPSAAVTGFRQQISYAFFDRPDGFLVRIGELGENPVHVRLTLDRGGWRVTALFN